MKITTNKLNKYYNEYSDDNSLFKVAMYEECFNLAAQHMNGANDDLNDLKYDANEANNEYEYILERYNEHEDVNTNEITYTLK